MWENLARNFKICKSSAEKEHTSYTWDEHTSYIRDEKISLLAHLESAYSLIWSSHEIWGKVGGNTLALL